MKDHTEITALVADYGYFIALAEKLSQSYDRVYYYSPFEKEYVEHNTCVLGTGIEGVERCDDFMRPEIFNDIDLFIFPDIGFAPLQHHLRDCGKAVWGAFDATTLELNRTDFLDVLQELDLPMAPSIVIEGITELGKHLEEVKDKWIKIDRYRGDMETWHHRDFQHSQRELERMALTLGPFKEHVTFVVQDTIKTDIEVGYDGWCVDGQFPSATFQGYEHKNELYLGSLRRYSQLPKEITTINTAIAPLLSNIGYRNFLATEVRVKNKEPYFIDPTFRMPGQTGEQLLETCTNLSEVIWHGANGELIEPKFNARYSASATLHYDALPPSQWRVMNIPKEVEQWVKPMHYCKVDDAYQFPPGLKDEVGVVLGKGNTIMETFAHLKKNLDLLKNEPVSCQLDGFFDLLDSIKSAQRKGIIFSDAPIPTKEAILKYAT